MMPRIDPIQMAAVQKVSKNIKARIIFDHKLNSVNITLTSEDPQAAVLIPKLLNQFTELFAAQMQTLFNIQGEIIDRNK